jgi:hypothetical protein
MAYLSWDSALQSNWTVEELLEELRKHKEALTVAMINLRACDSIYKIPGARRAAEVCEECLK